MVRFLCLILIPIFLLSNAVPRSYTGCGLVESPGDEVRPHVHLDSHHHAHDHHGHTHRGHSHHGHSHVVVDDEQAERVLVCATTDHDADAIYLTSVSYSMSVVSHLSLVPGQVVSWEVVSSLSNLRSELQYAAGVPPDKHASLPIFLLTAALRL